MSSKIIVARIMMITLIFSTFLLIQTSTTARTPSILKVPEDYPTIQDAVNAAEENTMIRVASGSYYESVSIVKEGISILGSNKSTTLIYGTKEDYTISIGGDGVEISGFTIQNGSISVLLASGCRIHDNIISNGRIVVGWDCYGLTINNNIINGTIRLSGSRHNIVENNCTRLSIREGSNNIENNIMEVLFTDISPYNYFRGNSISKIISINGVELTHFIQDIDESNIYRGRPIYFLYEQNDLIIDSSWYPDAGYLAFINSHNITIKDRELMNCSLLFAHCKGCNINSSKFQDAYGISFKYSNESVVGNNLFLNNSLGISLDNTNNNIIIGNSFLECGTGIYFIDSNDNIVVNNTLYKNFMGVYLTYRTNRNSFYYNNFVENEDYVGFYGRELVGDQYWDDGEHMGNYWSNYTGKDLNSDGVGDTPYIIDEENMDSYPSMNPFEIIPISHEVEIEGPEKGPEEAEEPFDGKPPTILMYGGIMGVAVAALIILFIYMRK